MRRAVTCSSQSAGTSRPRATNPGPGADDRNTLPDDMRIRRISDDTYGQEFPVVPPSCFLRNRGTAVLDPHLLGTPRRVDLEHDGAPHRTERRIPLWRQHPAHAASRIRDTGELGHG